MIIVWSVRLLLFGRVDITSGQHGLARPTRLAVDEIDSRLYWTSDGVVHASGLDGDDHAVVPDRRFYDSIVPDCVRLPEAAEHAVLWDRRAFDGRLPRPAANVMLLLAHIGPNDVSTTPRTTTTRVPIESEYLTRADYVVRSRVDRLAELALHVGFLVLSVQSYTSFVYFWFKKKKKKWLTFEMFKMIGWKEAAN